MSSSRGILTLCITGAFATALCAAEPADSTNLEPADSVVLESREQLKEMLPEGFMDSTVSIVAGRKATERKSPSGALLRSIAIPGWGQFYTGHPVRGTFTAVAETAFLVGAAIKFSDRADLRDKLSRLEKNNGPDWPVDDPERMRLNSRIKSAQHSGGDYLAYGVTALLMGMLDSYVSAHLYNFDRHFALAGSGRTELALKIGF